MKGVPDKSMNKNVGENLIQESKIYSSFLNNLIPIDNLLVD